MKLLALSLLALCLGCVPAQAITQAQGMVDISIGRQRVAPSPAYKSYAEKEEEAWAAQLYNLNGAKFSKAVLARLKARGKLPEGYSE